VRSLPVISVVIPTYNRKESLVRLLRSLAQQSCSPSQYEVVVADDGSTDGTGEAVQALRLPYELGYSWRANAGVNAARNRGLRQARGDIVLFLDDDMVADSRLIEEHVAGHESYPRAVLRGQVVLASDNPPDVFASLRANQQEIGSHPNGGIQEISYQQIGAGHFSIRREDALAIGGWDEELVDYGFQDLEFMYRCWEHGLRMFYSPTAVTHHHDYALTLAQCCDRIRRASTTAEPDLFRKHPELQGQVPMFRDKGYVSWREDPLPIIARKLIRGLMIQPPLLWGLEQLTHCVERLCPHPALLRPLYRWVLGAYICLGYREGLQKRNALKLNRT